ncbi:Flavin prenyltransferase UbiX [hydrothermal vent metagenome]|uniref:flavin prenyltransferase n=1 Tax=hydrothermal vent metagenome TaxID=652676 RepID=A0A3B1CYS0_9ZZZZ
MAKEKLIVGISGASGVIYGVRLLEAIKETIPAVETILVVTPGAAKTIEIETDYKIEQVKALADRVEDYYNLASSISSGSYKTIGMVVVPCSMRTLSDIASSNANNLLARAADVTLKERRKLVIVPRETPLHRGHLKLMITAFDNGAVILPPFPAFYHRPKSIDQLIDHTCGKILDQFEIANELFIRWGGGG